MLYNRKLDRLLILIVPAGLFVYASTRPQVRLRADMPPEFVDVPASASEKQREAEERLAREYWNLALTNIQWKYTYGSTLPDSPPDEFRLSTRLPGGSERQSSSQSRYWRRLQKVWLEPSVWVKSASWSTAWITDLIKRGAAWVDSHVDNMLQHR